MTNDQFPMTGEGEDTSSLVIGNWSLVIAAQRTWDVIVVGAGLAGSLAARQLARAGASVVLLDRAVFPRWKVCGCCLNPHAQSTLAAVGLGHLPTALGAVPLPVMRLAVRGIEARLNLPGWVSLSRLRLDHALVEEACAAGVVFLPGMTARLGPTQGEVRTLWVHPGHGEESSLSARLVLAADGLGGRLLVEGLRDQGEGVEVAPDSRVGVGVVIDQAPAFYQPGEIYMAHGRGGYLGLVRLEDGRLNLAAAFDAPFLRSCHPQGEPGVSAPGAAAVRMLAEVGWPMVPGLEHAHWKGTPALTRQPIQPGSERVLAVGDAAGYVEPFTGEGMAWALASGAAVAPLALRAVQRWRPELVREWGQVHRRIVRRRQWVCWTTAWLTRSPLLTRCVVASLSRLPWLATPFVRQIGGPALLLGGKR
jgi:flavin-dependent dehydrogenase